MAGQPPQNQIQTPAGTPASGFDISLFYLSDFEGKAGASSVFIPDEQLIRLPEQPCKLVQLFNWNVGNQPVFPSIAASANGEFLTIGEEIYYGFAGILVGQVFPSSNSGIFPISNLNQIVVRTRPGKSKTLWFAWWV